MKKILIIGATSLIAQEVAKVFASQKCEILLWGRNKEALDIVFNDLKVRGANMHSPICHDLNDMNAHPNLLEKAWNDLGGIDIAILAHGVLGDQERAENNPVEFFNIINSNFVSHVSLANELAEKMKRQGSGVIAEISSVAGDRGKQSNYIYGAAKGGTSIYMNGLRNRLYPHGIHVLTLKLGFVDTPMTKNFKKGFLWAQPQNVARSITTAIERKTNIAYIPGFWRLIMLIICNIPESFFKRLKL